MFKIKAMQERIIELINAKERHIRRIESLETKVKQLECDHSEVEFCSTTSSFDRKTGVLTLDYWFYPIKRCKKCKKTLEYFIDQDKFDKAKAAHLRAEAEKLDPTPKKKAKN